MAKSLDALKNSPVELHISAVRDELFTWLKFNAAHPEWKNPRVDTWQFEIDGKPVYAITLTKEQKPSLFPKILAKEIVAHAASLTKCIESENWPLAATKEAYLNGLRFALDVFEIQEQKESQ